MHKSRIFSLVLFLFTAFCMGCAPAVEKRSLAGLVAHFKDEKFNGEFKAQQGDASKADEVGSFEGPKLKTILYRYSDSSKASDHPKGVAGRRLYINDTFAMEVFKGDDKLTAAFMQFQP